MKFLKNIWALVFSTPTVAEPPIRLFKSDETQAMEMAERIAVLEDLVFAFKTDRHVQFAMATSDHINNLQELARLKFRLEAILANRKDKTLVERLTAENANLLNDLRAAENKYQRDVYGLNNEGDPIGGEPAGGFANAAAHFKKLWLDSRLNEITDYRDLKEFEHYWLLSRDFDSLHVAQCKGKTISGHWIVEDNHLNTMGKYRFFGPIQKPEIKKAYFDPVVATDANET